MADKLANSSRFDTAFACAKNPSIKRRSTELYARWISIAARCRSELALVEASSGRRWSFDELARAGESGGASEAVAFPQGNNAEFIIGLLRAWRQGTITCPLEPGQAAPALGEIPSGCAHLKLTSGSTGPAKSVVFTAQQLAADARNIVCTMGLRPEWPNLGVISLAHSYGFSNLVLPLVLHGVPLILASAPLPEAVLKAARQASEVTLAAVPALWRTWVAAKSIPPNVRLAISAGAPLPLELERALFDSQGLKVHNFYGSSECGGIAYDRCDVPRESSTITGSALDGVQLSISELGTLVVRGEAVGESYWPDASPELAAGAFRSSDLAEIVNGEVRLTGRTSDLINVAGRKVAPEQIEAVLRRHPGVIECLVFGIPTDEHERFEIIVGAVNSANPLPLAQLNAFLSAEIPNWQLPRKWWFTRELTANVRGKISRREWRDKYLAAMLNNPP